MPKISTTNDYFNAVIDDPVVAVLFKDKIVIVRQNGALVERELACGDEDFDDMPEGRG